MMYDTIRKKEWGTLRDRGPQAVMNVREEALPAAKEEKDESVYLAP